MAAIGGFNGGLMTLPPQGATAQVSGGRGTDTLSAGFVSGGKGTDKIETATLSPAATQAAAYEKSSKAFDRFTGAFGKLPEGDKKELGGLIGQRLTEASAAYEQKTGKKLTEAQAAELKWSTMASVSAEWAGNKAGSPDNKDPNATRNLGDLYYGGREYGASRLEYINAGGKIGQ